MSRCPDAITCQHRPAVPTLDYLDAKDDADALTLHRQFPRWPSWHLAAIVRARREHPGRWREARRLEAVQTAMRRADRGRP